MASRSIVSQFLYSSITGNALWNSNTNGWLDISQQLALVFSESDGGSYLIRLTVPDTWNDTAGCGAGFRLVLLQPGGLDVMLGTGFYHSAIALQRVPFSLVARADVYPESGPLVITAQWTARQGGKAWIGALGLCSLTAIGA